MSSHREAPETSKDPAADNTDVYAFVSPDNPDTVTLIANFIPFQLADGGPNFNEFSEDVSYRIHVSNNGSDAMDDIVFEFSFTTNVRNGNTFLYNTGPITSLDAPTWNRFQTYTVKKFTRADMTTGTTLGTGLMAPPCNVGERSTPNYEDLANAAVHALGQGVKVFAGQRAEGFFVDLGAIFDLGTLRPFEDHHLIPSAAAGGVNSTQQLNVHSIAMQIPKTLLTKDGSTPTDVMSPTSVIGVYASASRQVSSVFNPKTGKKSVTGPLVQVSRLANPLINEVINPMGQKDAWNASAPSNDSTYAQNYKRPGLSALLPTLYPGVFPNLANLNSKDRTDIVAILLTGLPAGIVPGFQNYTGSVQADLVRLNMAVPPTTSNPNPIGLIAGDAAGFPNGRRVFDDVVAIELRALAGATYPLVDSSYTPDAAAGALKDGTSNTNSAYRTSFPYLGSPNSGSKVKPGQAAA